MSALTSREISPNNLVEVNNLVKYFPVKSGLFGRVVEWVRAVDDISFAIREKETLGMVGESGCGKTTVGRTILRLIEPNQGQISFDGIDIMSLKGRALKEIRQKMQIIFQDPFASLDPRMSIGDSIMEGLNIHKIGTKDERIEIMLETLKKVGLEEYHTRRYPHEFSGGQRQRIGIARALALRPKFIICDEPVSALDVSIQSQVLNTLRDLQDEFSLTYLFIAHNLSVVEHFSDRVVVMYLGKIMELADRDELYREPLHPYTKALMSAIPIPDPKMKRERTIIEGDVPSPIHIPKGCRFHPRCPLVIGICLEEEPAFKQVSPDHWVACWAVE